MDIDFSLFIIEIKSKTDLDLVIFTENGEVVSKPIKPNEASTFRFTDGILQSEENNATYFHFEKYGRGYIGKIDGVSKIEENYAALILTLIENYDFSEIKLSKAEFYNALFENKLNYAKVSRYKEIFAIPSSRCFAMILNYGDKEKEDVLNILSNFIEGATDCVIDIDENRSVFVKYIDKNSEEYQSSTEYAEFLYKSVYEEMGSGVTIAVGGTVKSIFELAVSFSQATWAERMAKAISSKSSVQSFKEYTLVKMLEDLPKEKLGEYLDLLLDGEAKQLFLDEEMINTAEEFLEEDLNTSETSRKLFLHRNTLTYRLDKIEKMTGLNLRKFSDAVTFRLITILYKLVK